MIQQSPIRNPQSAAGLPLEHLLERFVRSWSQHAREFASYRDRFPATETKPEPLLKLCRSHRDYWIARLRAERRMNKESRNSGNLLFSCIPHAQPPPVWKTDSFAIPIRAMGGNQQSRTRIQEAAL